MVEERVAFVAQLAERSAVNRQVPGSIPGEGVFFVRSQFYPLFTE